MKDSNFLLLLSVGWLLAQFFAVNTPHFWVFAFMMNGYLIAHYIVKHLEKDKDE